jgi:hypothetical protein
MKTELLAISMLFFIGIAFAVSPAEVVVQSKNLTNSDISLLTGKHILPLSGVNPSIFTSAAFMRGSLDTLGNYYTTSMMDFLSSGLSDGNPNTTRKGAMVGLLNRYSTQNLGE